MASAKRKPVIGVWGVWGWSNANNNRAVTINTVIPHNNCQSGKFWGMYTVCLLFFFIFWVLMYIPLCYGPYCVNKCVWIDGWISSLEIIKQITGTRLQ